MSTPPAEARAPEAIESSADPETRRFRLGRIVAFGVLPALVLLLAAVGGYLKYQSNTITDDQAAAVSSVRAAREGTIALLSYTPDTAEATLKAARDLLTGAFRDSYTSLTTDVVIPDRSRRRSQPPRLCPPPRRCRPARNMRSSWSSLINP